MATLKLYNPILSEATKECYWFCDEAGTSFKDVDEFINGIPAGDDNIELLLHCDGGEVNEGWAIVDKLRSTGKKITATIEGNCASMATVVLLAASERRAYPHGSWWSLTNSMHCATVYPTICSDSIDWRRSDALWVCISSYARKIPWVRSMPI